MKRRDFLNSMARYGLSFSLIPGSQLLALETDGLKVQDMKLQLGMLQLGPSWNQRANSLNRLIGEVRRRCNIPINTRVAEVRTRDINSLTTPVLFLSGRDAFPVPSQAEARQIRWILDSGGFLFFDDQDGGEHSPFYASAKTFMAKVFPETPEPMALPEDHTLYQSYYLLKQPRGRNARADFLEGWNRGITTPAMFSHNDLLGALEADASGNWRYNLEIGGGFRRELCFRLGINLMYYILTLNYKKDRAFPPILQRRRRQ